MTITSENPVGYDEYPRKADLRTMMAQAPLPTISPDTIALVSLPDDEAQTQTVQVINAFNVALAENNAAKLEDCFFPEQSYWKDSLALTYHLRTIATRSAIAASLLETTRLRKLAGGIRLEGAPRLIPVTPSLQFIDSAFTFKTASPAASCSGRLLLLSVKASGPNGENAINWKIWVLSTRLESLDVQQEDEALLQTPNRPLTDSETFETDVFIIGGGNAAIALAARLKALGVESILAERNARPGDNWALRYDTMKFHIPTSFCDLPYMGYDAKLRAPHLLTRDELAEQVRRYVAAYNLNFVTSAEIESTEYHEPAKKWQIAFRTPNGRHIVVARHLVQATGIGSQRPLIPNISDSQLYKGISLHSAHFKNALELKEKGVKSVLVIGSANTAFDVLEECHATGLQTTMVVRSATYICPVQYVCDKASLGAYDVSVEAADRNFLTLPSTVDAQLASGLFALFASQEPDRYAALAKAGFPVLDSSHPECVLMHNLIERAGGHYIDMGSTELLAKGQAGIKALVEPVAYTETGLRFSDGSTLDADAIVWCTGYADKNVRDTTAEILGGGNSCAPERINGSPEEVHEEKEKKKHVLGPREVADRLDATWGVDAEGEIRGMWKRHLRMDNYWVMGGYTQQHRWHSRTLALQIKASLEDILPPAYRETPDVPTNAHGSE